MSQLRKEEQELSDSITAFSLDVYKEAVLSNEGSSVFVSPSSIYVVLAMLHAGARNKTLAEMTKTLRLKSSDAQECYEKMGDFFSILMKGSNSVALNCANRVYPNTDRNILEVYTLLVQKYFATSVKPLNYKANAEGSRKEINDWVEEQTKQKIKDLVPSGSITSDTAMVVVNAIYFKGGWLTPFEKVDTQKQDFFKSKTSKTQIDMMHKELKDVRYGENAPMNCKILEIFYRGKEHRMIILLPNETEDLESIEAKLSLEVLRTAVAGTVNETVTVTLPKFKLESSFQLKPMLAKLGMASAFDMTTADFTGMGNQLYVSEVFHKTFVEVNEEGTEAAGATAAVMLLECALVMRTIEFKADHPFLFVIWDHRINAPLFLGRYMGN